MQRPRFSILASLCFFAAVACSENPNAIKLFSGRAAAVVTPTATLDQSIDQLIALFPKDLGARDEQRIQQGQNEDLNPLAEWNSIKRKYAAGIFNPAQLTAAKKQLFRLSDWITRNAQEMTTPPAGETKTAAAARLVLYMSLYVYGGPTTPPPSYTPGADAVVGVVTPNAPATIVTPTLNAGVQFEAGSVAENTIIVVTQNPTPYPANCSGPLQTKLCQYPQFYTFDAFPHKRFLKAAKFNVCHVNSGETRRPLADHNRFRLAHAKPADPADYTPGSTIRDQNGESIEILPQVAQTFSTCVNNAYANNARTGGPLGVLSQFARGLQNLVSPRTAYAVDVGLGGLGIDTSPFNDVDPLGLPDLAVQSFSVAPTSVLAGAHVTLSYTVKNIGTATGGSVPATVFLTPPAGEGPPPARRQIGLISIPLLVPGATDTRTDVVVTIPQPLPPGTYHISLVVGSDPAFPDADPANNSATATVTVTVRVAGKPLYVANQNGNSIIVYAAGASGNATPTDTIAGGNTGLNFPNGIARDGAGNIYVTNLFGNTITVYAAGASGNATPTATIAGGNTGLNCPSGIARDGAGNIYVANFCPNTITIYAAGASGNATPTATIAGGNTGLNFPVGIARDGAGTIYVANEGSASNVTNTITVYAAGASGNATPTATIAGGNTGLNLPVGIALDGAGNIYVTNAGAGGTQSITVYAAGASGNATPTATISGSNTRLNAPAMITF